MHHVDFGIISRMRPICYWFIGSVRRVLQKAKSTPLIAGVRVYHKGALPPWKSKYEGSANFTLSVSKGGISSLVIHQRSAAGLYTASYSMRWQRERNLEQIDEWRYTALKWSELRHCSRVFRGNSINYPCWYFQRARYNWMTEVIYQIRKQFTLFRFRVIPASYNNVNICRTWSMYSSDLSKNMTI